MANVDKILPGYPQSVGAKIQFIVDHAGPSSYVTGGETYPATNLNIGGFDKVEAGASFGATAGSATDTNSASAVIASGSQGNGVASVLIKWFVVSTGAEVGAGVNLNGQYVRLNIFGY